MNTRLIGLLSGAAIVSSVVVAAPVSAFSVSGSGTLSNVGDSISGVFDLGAETVDYTLTLNNISGVSEIGWNGALRSEQSPNPGFIFHSGAPSVTDTWTATLSFSKAITADWAQGVSPQWDFWNGHMSKFNLAWADATSAPDIFDPNAQLQEETTNIGSAEFRMSDSPGVGLPQYKAVPTSMASWSVQGVASSEITLTWSATNATLANWEGIAMVGDSIAVADVQDVPEPMAIVGSLFAFGLCSVMKKRDVA